MRLVIDLPPTLAARITAIRFPHAFHAMTLAEKLVFLADNGLTDYEANIYAFVPDEHKNLIREALPDDYCDDDLPF